MTAILFVIRDGMRWLFTLYGLSTLLCGYRHPHMGYRHSYVGYRHSHMGCWFCVQACHELLDWSSELGGAKLELLQPRVSTLVRRARLWASEELRRGLAIVNGFNRFSSSCISSHTLYITHTHFAERIS